MFIDGGIERFFEIIYKINFQFHSYRFLIMITNSTIMSIKMFIKLKFIKVFLKKYYREQI